MQPAADTTEPGRTAVPQREPTPGRFVRALRRWRWPVLAGWVVAAVLLFPYSNGLSSATHDTAAANLPSSAPSTRVAELQESAERGQPHSDQVTVVFVRDTGLTAADLRTIESEREAVTGLAGPIGSGGSVSAGGAAGRGDLGAAGPVQRSADGTAAGFTADVTAYPADLTGSDTDAVKAVRAAVAGSAGDGLRVAVTGSAAVTADSGIGNQSTLLLTSLAIVLIILLIVYRSPLLWVFPLLGTLAALILAKAVTHALAGAGLTVTSLSTAILTVLVLGTSTDYAMLLIHRYREELRLHPTPAEAMGVALRRTLPVVGASAATVVAAMLCLLAAQSAALRGLGPVAAVSVVSALLAQVTLLPAVLLVVGRPGFWPSVPRRAAAGRDESRIWAAVGRRVARRPLPVAGAALALLGVACVGLATLHTDNDPVAAVKGHPGSVTGARMLAGHFPPGATAPLLLLAPPGEAGTAAAAAAATAHVASVSPTSPVGGYSGYTVVMSVPPYGASGYATIADLRHRLERVAPGSLIGGGPAVQYDTDRAAHRDAIVLIPLILAVILVIVSVLLRAIVAPLILVVTTALSFAASLGLSSLLWRALGFSGIEAQLPLYIFVFLVALGVDYNIFLVARIREVGRRAGIREGTLRGLSVTGGVITAAGVVLAATFAALARLPLVPVAEVGIAIAVGVLLDTLLVRTVLVPAGLLAIGESVWWPSRVGRDGTPSGVRPAASPAR
ncbi:MMPL family transporter [Rugosimonospora africana]|uniref:Membrane protein n=1 Tax=Rugosimonospora africana TaxID=556532 RepID=A0A8J3VQE0_9ACTN|nr:MMPL family transporter [Rugosimonospora africana]GIH14366.1 membrane protein [Rugosimonospora africana]